MKKQLLFAAMLMLSAAPAVSVSAAQPFAAAAEEGQTLATQEQFNTMMARIDEILREAQKIVDEAKEAEKVATGISGITVSEAVKAGKVYSIDGKRVSKSAKGLVIINGKKVIL